MKYLIILPEPNEFGLSKIDFLQTNYLGSLKIDQPAVLFSFTYQSQLHLFLISFITVSLVIYAFDQKNYKIPITSLSHRLGTIKTDPFLKDLDKLDFSNSSSFISMFNIIYK